MIAANRLRWYDVAVGMGICYILYSIFYVLFLLLLLTDNDDKYVPILSVILWPCRVAAIVLVGVLTRLRMVALARHGQVPAGDECAQGCTSCLCAYFCTTCVAAQVMRWIDDDDEQDPEGNVMHKEMILVQNVNCDTDILCSQPDSKTNPGNQHLRQLIDEHRESYHEAARRRDAATQDGIVDDILAKVQAQGGRFLKPVKRNSDDGYYYDVTHTDENRRNMESALSLPIAAGGGARRRDNNKRNAPSKTTQPFVDVSIV